MRCISYWVYVVISSYRGRCVVSSERMARIAENVCAW